ncbi:MAG TPA: FHA domain-containing protein [Armatimonadota bacterium]|jgi:pSer/pThr/pTyr-binding forkhead associated (FHA) protein
MTDERTQMVAAVTCPVCGEENTGVVEWCVECGFRLGTAPGDAPSAPATGWMLEADGISHPLRAGENVVGRLNADVFLSDPSISRRHAVITVGDGKATVRDEGSSNGTRVAAHRLEPGVEMPLAPGETVQFGLVKLSVRAPEGVEAPELAEAAAPETAPAALTNGSARFPLRSGPNSIGRRLENDIVLDDSFVSGRHAVITVREDDATLTDVGSTNGTFLGDRRLAAGLAETIPFETTIRFGSAEWTLTREAGADA